MKLNFQKFTIPIDIAGKQKKEGDVRESFANLIYTNVSGIGAHALAFKIYKSEGEVEYSDEEMKTIQDIANKLTTPAFIEGLKLQTEG